MVVTEQPGTGDSLASAPNELAGVELDRDTYVLRWESGPLAGVVVRARRPTSAGYLDLAMADGPPPTDAAPTSPEVADRMYRTLRAFAGALLSWNVLDCGEPVPATLDGLLSLDLAHALELTYTWLDKTGCRRGADQRTTEAGLQLPVEPLG